LLTSIDDKKAIKKYIAEFAPNRPVSQSITEWIEALSESKAINLKLNETALSILKLTLEERPHNEICSALTAQYKIGNSARLSGDVRQFRNVLHSIPLIKNIV
jgi:hypothetical protein